MAHSDQGSPSATPAALGPERKAARVMFAAGGALLLGAGLLLWWGQGEAVFGTTVLAALAWCF